MPANRFVNSAYVPSPQQEGFLVIVKLQNNEIERIKSSNSAWISPAEYAKLRGISEDSLCR